MIKLLKYLGWINLIGFPIALIIMIIALWYRPFAWGEEMLLLNSVFCVLFSSVGIITIRNLVITNHKHVQRLFFYSICLCIVPIFILPFIFDLSELIIWGGCIISSLFILFKLRKGNNKLIFPNILGILILTTNLLVSIGHL